METSLQKAVRHLLIVAMECENYAAELDPDKDAPVIDYFNDHSKLLRVMANDWLPDKSTDNVVLLQAAGDLGALPPENTRRFRTDPSRT